MFRYVKFIFFIFGGYACPRLVLTVLGQLYEKYDFINETGKKGLDIVKNGWKGETIENFDGEGNGRKRSLIVYFRNTQALAWFLLD